MERLTKRIGGGIERVCHYGHAGKCYGCADRTKCNADIFDRLAHYEDLEEQGRLVETPVTVGDTVWFLRPLEIKKHIEETEVEKIVVKGKGLYLKLACNAMYETSCKSIGKTVFLTRPEAEAALAASGKEG